MFCQILNNLITLNKSQQKNKPFGTDGKDLASFPHNKGLFRGK